MIFPCLIFALNVIIRFRIDDNDFCASAVRPMGCRGFAFDSSVPLCIRVASESAISVYVAGPNGGVL